LFAGQKTAVLLLASRPLFDSWPEDLCMIAGQQTAVNPCILWSSWMLLVSCQDI